MTNRKAGARAALAVALGLSLFGGSHALANMGSGHKIVAGCEVSDNAAPNMCNTTGWNLSKISPGYQTQGGYSWIGTNGTVAVGLYCYDDLQGGYRLGVSSISPGGDPYKNVVACRNDLAVAASPTRSECGPLATCTPQ